jgi:hypothetical protein
MKDNRHTQTIPSTILAQAQAKIDEAKTLLAPYLLALTPAERRELPKMGEKTIAFVEKAFDFARQNPNLIPPYLDVDAFDVLKTRFPQTGRPRGASHPDASPSRRPNVLQNPDNLALGQINSVRRGITGVPNITDSTQRGTTGVSGQRPEIEAVQSGFERELSYRTT